ncbi:MAG: CRISPR-associated protein Cas4 [Clostridium sp.]
MKDYKEDDFLMLSGIQHFTFCPRQWALIHIEQQWKENYFTVDGSILHENAHDQGFTEKRKDILITRGMPVFSRILGINGMCDVVEFHRDKSGITLYNYEGLFLPVPIEYKRGKPKEHDADALQLCAQAICLEEMLVCRIEKGYLYYGETKRRQEIWFDNELRNKVVEICGKMHEYYEKQFTPKVKTSKACNSCSLAEICLPQLNRITSVKAYIEQSFQEDSI